MKIQYMKIQKNFNVFHILKYNFIAAYMQSFTDS